MPSRRQFLAACAAGAVGALAGCVETDVATFVDPVPDDEAIARQATADPGDSLDDADADLVARAVDAEDSAEVVAERPPYEPIRPVRHDGAVYVLEWSSAGSVTRTEYGIGVTAGPSVDREPEIALEELPAVDRRAIEPLVVPDPGQLDHEARLSDTYSYDEAERERSVLVPDQQYEVVGIDGTPVVVDAGRVTVDQTAYEYVAEELAPSLAAFGRQVREAYLFELDGLNDAERQFFENVIDEGAHYASGPGEAQRGVYDRFVTEPAIVVEHEQGEWLVDHDGGRYWVAIDFVRLQEYGDRLELADGPVAVAGGLEVYEHERDESARRPNGVRNGTDGARNETGGTGNETGGTGNETDGARNETDGARNETDGTGNETDGSADGQP